ncbi:MAG: protein kinase, partial [Rikenellaceae bacterium]|nr:protein kinase [Rikenellaceae bacterium]
MLDDFAIGDPISEHSGVRCCPAMHKESENKYIVKIITIPPTEAQIDALVLSGAYPDKASALKYFKALADDIIGEVKILNSLATAEGFLPIDATQVVESEDESGYDVYLRSAYAVTLQRQMRNGSLTHLSALNLGLDLCAALAAARHNGYLYIDLKPANIYIGNANEYRIGDIGFIRLDSLRYASLPERYRSEYTAPEITDAYASLNTTLDIYALGQVLYQVFNDGNLPVADESGVIPAPAYADYEIAEIILKACALNPEDRWQDPTELGQALITYMQKNGAHDTPITPVAPFAEPAEVVLTTDEADGAYVKTDEEDSEVAPEEATEEAESEAVEEVDDAVTAEEITEEDIYTEDEDGNLTLIEEETDETETETATEDIDYTEVSDEVSGILQQADDLIEHEVPDPVVQPEPIDVPMPEPIVLEEQVETVEESDEAREVAENTEEESATEEDTETADEETAEEDSAPVEDAEKVPASGEEESEELPDEEIEDEEPAPKKSNTGKWVAGILITLLVAALLVAGFFFVKEYYLQSIDAITLTAGNAGELYVGITTEADEAELVVVCTNTYGNKQTATLKDGKAFFKDLMPNSAYTISIEKTG